MAGRKINSFRIISGSWRGRRLDFPDEPDIRPTPDRVREDLFNWLTPWIHGARCLDLYAGSGALGLESLSRGAEYVDFVDLNASACRSIEKHLTLLKAETQAKVSRRSVVDFIREVPASSYDVVYLDPPFGQDILPRICDTLESSGVLKVGAHVYLESELGFDPHCLPATWELTKSKRASKVVYYLVQRRM